GPGGAARRGLRGRVDSHRPPGTCHGDRAGKRAGDGGRLRIRRRRHDAGGGRRPAGQPGGAGVDSRRDGQRAGPRPGPAARAGGGGWVPDRASSAAVRRRPRGREPLPDDGLGRARRGGDGLAGHPLQVAVRQGGRRGSGPAGVAALHLSRLRVGRRRRADGSHLRRRLEHTPLWGRPPPRAGRPHRRRVARSGAFSRHRARRRAIFRLGSAPLGSRPAPRRHREARPRGAVRGTGGLAGPGGRRPLPGAAASHRPAVAGTAFRAGSGGLLTDPTHPRSPRPLDPIFSPHAVAVVGASRRRESLSFRLIHNLVVNEFSGVIFPVNPQASALHSLKCYPTVAAIPDPVDLAIIMVPRDKVQGMVEECVAKGVKGLIVITAGFSETGKEGAALERRLRETVRAAGVRMIGPNCMGVINTDAEVTLDATFSPTPARRGAIGFVSQSGALGVAILNVAQDIGVGLTQFVSMGNKADVSGNDLIEHWEDDPETLVIAMYLESFGNPRRFTEIAKRVTRKKPILVVKSGRTAEGARAATSHTGAIAGTDVTVSAFLEQCGVLRANTIEEMFDVARALARVPLPSGSRVGIVTNAGGPAIMATDACVNLGLQIAELSDATRATLRSFLPPEASVGNPVDMIASATPENYAKSVAAVLDDPAVDMVMVINVTPVLANPIDVLQSIAAVTRDRPKPVLAVMMATEEFYDAVKTQRDLPPVYHFPEPAARVMYLLARYAAWCRRPADRAAPDFATDDARVAEILGEVKDGYLDQA